MVDKIKFVVALLLVGAGVVGFYLMGDQQYTILRVLSVLAGLAAGAAVGWYTEPGQRFVVFGREAYAESRKVVWPTRKDTLQTTGAVFAFVLAMAVMLFATDKTLEYVLYHLILGWK